MRYDELHRIYPNIEELFSGTAGYTHDSQAGPEMAMGWAELWIARCIAKQHQKSVAQKIQKFISAITST